jgi:hypothetical protein
MSGAGYDTSVQVRLDGPLTPQFRERVRAAKSKHNQIYENIAHAAGFSGTYLANMVRDPDRAVNTKKYAAPLAAVIDALEREDVGSPAIADLLRGPQSAATPPQDPPTPASDSIAYALTILRRHGLGVILISPGTSVTVPITAGQ